MGGVGLGRVDMGTGMQEVRCESGWGISEEGWKNMLRETGFPHTTVLRIEEQNNFSSKHGSLLVTSQMEFLPTS